MFTTRRPGHLRLATAAVLTPLVLGLAACGDDGDDDVDNDGAVSTPTAVAAPVTPPASTTPAAPAADASLETVAQTALGAVDGTIFTIDRDDTGGWEVSVVSADGTDNEVGIAADGTTITRGPSVDDDGDDDGDDAAERERLLDASLNWAAAVEAALGSQPGGVVTGVDLDEDNGTATWDVQLGEDTPDAVTVDVDANSGDVLRTERDD